MTRLVEDLLLLARLDQGRPLGAERLDLAELAQEAVADARAVDPGRTWNLDVPPPGTAEIRGDRDRLRQVVANLVANVLTHTPTGTPADISVGAEEATVTLRVADHGPGVDPAHAAHVFDRFYRVDPGRTRARGGSGLGLSIVASIVAAHGGTTTHEPTPGGGATFIVRVPRTGQS